MIGGIAGTPISRTYYGLGDFTTPIVVSLVGFACYSILKLLLSWQFSFYGIAIGSSIGCLSNAFVLVALLKRRVPQLSLVLAAQAFLRPTAAAVAAAIPALIARRYLGDNGLAAAFVPAIIYACGYGLFHLSFLLRTFNSRIRVNAIG
jgi:peptidoglycan biosynthesis protein MviN/MurJ (putative lipid II flippase)